MICTFYNTNDDYRKINKSLYDSEQTTCDIINNTDIIRPQILVDSRYINKNYVYLNDLSRYYYATNTVISNGMIIMDLIIDPLYTYKNEILSTPLYVARVEDFRFTDVYDPLLQVTEKKYIETYKISAPVITRTTDYILTVR